MPRFAMRGEATGPSAGAAALLLVGRRPVQALVGRGLVQVLAGRVVVGVVVDRVVIVNAEARVLVLEQSLRRSSAGPLLSARTSEPPDDPVDEAGGLEEADVELSLPEVQPGVVAEVADFLERLHRVAAVRSEPGPPVRLIEEWDALVVVVAPWPWG